MPPGSATHVTAALQQRSILGAGGAWQPLAFFLKKLSDTETRYSTFDHELLGAYLDVPHFRFALEGRQFCLPNLSLTASTSPSASDSSCAIVNLYLDFTILPPAQLLCDQVKSLASDPRFKVKEVGPQGL